jgi:uncharacterized protein (DUF1330 family)
LKGETPVSDETRKAYWVARVKVHDPVSYGRYAEQVPEIVAKFGGRFLARGGRFNVLEGTDKFDRFVVVEFPSFEQAQACHDSAEYTAAAAHRRNGAGENDLIIVEAAAPPAV